jgi:putative transposase
MLELLRMASFEIAVVGLADGVRESALSWKELLLDLKRRGFDVAPELAIADGALGFWKALGEVWGKTREQRCWVHKTANVKGQDRASEHWMADTKAGAKAAFDHFVEVYGEHLRSTNPIESTFATVRHRTIRSKGCLSNKTALAMVYKLTDAAQKSWRRLDGPNQLPKLIQGVKFTDGVEVISPQTQAAA